MERPAYRRDKVYGKGSSTGSSHGTSHASAQASFSGLASGQSFYTPDNWFGSPTQAGMVSDTTSSGSTSSTSSGNSDSDSYSSSESEADIPIFFPVPFQELSTVQYYSIEEQLTELTAALKLQFQRHCFIQIRQQETQPMLVPFVEPVTTFTFSRKNLDWYIHRQHEKQRALPAAEVDALLEQQETALLQAAKATLTVTPPADVATAEPADNFMPGDQSADSPIWNRAAHTVEVLPAAPRKRGPKPDRENQNKVAALIRVYGESWITDDNLIEICDELDRQKIPLPKTWLMRKEGSARSWNRGRQQYPHLVIKAIKDRCKAAQVAATSI